MITLLAGILAPFNYVQSQQRTLSLQNTAFAGAEVQFSRSAHFPEDIKLEASNPMGKKEFFTALRQTFDVPEQIQFVPEKEHVGPMNNTHIRYKLHYRGLELNQTQYVLHLKNDQVLHAHGRLVDLENVDVTPSLSKEEAYEFACTHLGLSEYDTKRKSRLQSMLTAGNEEQSQDGRLLLSAGFSKKTGENYRLVYRFDVYITDPIQRYDVDIDAHTGKLVAKYPTLFHENIPTKGLSPYNDTVDIVVSDSLALEELLFPDDHWHLDAWRAYADSGMSWWTSDTTSFSPGGYFDDWHEAITTEAIIVSGSNPRLEFVHRYSLELPDGASDYDEQYDGWDGINIRISLDQGESWSVLDNPEPAYTCTSLWSFGGIHGEGPGIPGWAGSSMEWTRVSFDLSDYQDDTVLIRFEFASDGGFSTWNDSTLFGWQIDEITVLSDGGIHFSNTGDTSNISSQNLFQMAGFSEGKYRLRETTRGKGILTLNAGSGEGFSTYVDYVQDQLPVLDDEDRAGVGIHWAAEKTYDFYMETFNRNSYDDEGGVLVSYADWMVGDVRFNAFWSGGYAAYGAGDGEEVGSLGTLDVVGHEITHGVTQHSAGLVYQGESGALNESFSDIFGIAVEFYAEGRDKGDWLIGEDISESTTFFIRSLENPKEYGDPDTYKGEFWADTKGEDDNGGVHTNSGVQNHWFYLLSEGGDGTNDDNLPYNVQGIGLDDASAIAYRNLTLYLLPDSKYHEAAQHSIQSARDLYGEDSQQVNSTLNAWDAVGIYLYPRLVSSVFSLPFSVNVGSSDSITTVTLTNEGTEPLSIYDLQFSISESFSLSGDQQLPVELDRSESLKLSVKFTPDSAGAHMDTLTIRSSDAKDTLMHIPFTRVGRELTTSLPENSEVTDAELVVYPNPAKNHIFIYTGEYSKLTGYQMKIFDQLGSTVFETYVDKPLYEVNLSKWTGKGFYFVQLFDQDGSILEIRKIVLQ